ncbi:DNA mismatch repair protein MutS [Carboxylicivirga sp. M1479]|uniref:MutS-related protein n=1 Tax=Carboxylicivirga sp. M1479 TaxID=2594476 RepID=UPI001178B9AB|nr:DNA mismatch repair protein MutS [Carboxylicivirga sp. M1479]TRX72456.1 DNA mismatch repair protein MutS [Carboxylicivirga sp. M1479]
MILPNNDFKSIADYFKKSKENTDRTVNDRTCIDLDFHDFFNSVDYTQSKPGQQCLYARLRNLGNGLLGVDSSEQLIHFLQENHEALNRVKKNLNRLNSHDAYYINSLFQDEPLAKPKWLWLMPILSFTSLALSVLSFFQFIFLVPLILLVVVNLLIHYWNKKNVYVYINGISQLLELIRCAKLLDKEDLPQLPGIGDDIKLLQTLKWQFAFFKIESKFQSDFTMLLWGVFELIKIIGLLEPLLFYKTIGSISNKRSAIKRVFQYVGELDVMVSTIRLRENLPFYCLPKINDENQFEGFEVYHPLIEKCVTNSFSLSNKSMLLTGSNMSGKTSFIRMVGLNAIAAFALNTCFASKFTLPILSIFSAIRMSDDLLNDKSYYFEEVLTIKHLLDMSKQKPCLLLLDEVFKGTNTIERIAIAKSVLSDLAHKTNFVLAATHDIELTELLSHQYDLFHFCEQVNNRDVDFDYRLKEGALKQTNAIRILEANAYPASVVSEARVIANKLQLQNN